MGILDSSAFKRETFYALENLRQGSPAAKLIGIFLFFLIIANAGVVLFSVQADMEPITSGILSVFLVFSTICFCIEYIARIWIADLVFRNYTRPKARMRYILSPMGVIDLLSFAPNMISWFLPVTSAIAHAVNVLRLIRLVKVTRYMRGFRTMGRVLRKRNREIVAALLVIILVIIVTSVVMYEVEHEAQPAAFNNLFQGIWYAVETVTGTGYGDIVPITVPGKICGMVIMILSLGLVAIPGGIFSAGFVAEFQNAKVLKDERDAEDTHHVASKQEGHDDHNDVHDHVGACDRDDSRNHDDDRG